MASLKALFQGPPKMPKPKTVLMPDEKALADAKKRSIAAQKNRSGRASTMLSESDSLGG